MKLLSWNIRGLGKNEKKGMLKKLLRVRNVDFLLIQESKLRSVNNFFVNSIWGHSSFGFFEVETNESKGGLLCVWNSELFSLIQACNNRNFLLLYDSISPNFYCTIVNVYGPCSIADKKKLWDILCSLRNQFPAPWCLGGDLNEIRNLEERQGCSLRDRGMRDLNKFIDDMEFLDMQLLG